MDDNPATRYSTSRILRSAGYDVAEARSGSDALQQVDAATDLVLLDINMPDLNGYEVCRALRARTDTARVPVVHISAISVTEMDKVLGLEAGADGYLVHPVEPLVLVGTVNAFLRTRRAEEALRRGEAKFRAVFDHAPSGIALVDESLVYLDVNPAMCRFLGRSRDAILGAPMAPDLSLGVDAALERDGQWRGTVRLVHQDGREVDIDWHLINHPDAVAYGPRVRLAIATDATERRRIEAERERLLASERAARSDAERANRAKDEFLATLSHELRNPLNAILGWASTLHRRYPTGDVGIGLDTIVRNARVQARLIADLLDVSSIASGKLRLDVDVIDPAPVIEAAVEVLAPSAAAGGIRIDRTLPTGLGAVWADAARLEQIVWNLLSNAIKFTPRGGTVEVRLRRVGATIELSVRDDGTG
ncbi:MAG: response regulator, partial [Myxococcota bacterium]